MQLYVELILLFGSLALLVLFYFYDQKCSKHKIFYPEMFNPTVVNVELLIFMITFSNYCERLQMPYCLTITHNLTTI